MNMRWLYRLLRVYGDAQAAQHGPAAIAKRHARRRAHRALARWLRKL